MEVLCDTYHRVVTYVTVTVTQSHDTEKNIKGSGTDDII